MGEAVLTVSVREYSEDLQIKVIPKAKTIGGIEESISLTTGDTIELKPELKPDEFTKEPVAFSTGDDKVATVSKDGVLTAASAGETSLTVIAGGCTFTAAVSVSDPVVYYQTAASGSSKKTTSKFKKKKSSSSGSKGYFDSSDDEHF